MPKVRICVDVEEQAFRAFEGEAQREGVSVESLLERVVAGLLRDLEREEKEGLDFPIVPA